MQNNQDQTAALRAQIVDILGLETAPDGIPEHLLTRDENGKVLEGVDMHEEVDAFMAAVAAEKARAVLEGQLNILKGFRRMDFVLPEMYQAAVIDRIADLTKQLNGDGK